MCTDLKRLKIENGIIAVGKDIASLWGGSYLGYTFDTKENEIVFHCIEHNEEFVTRLSVSEVTEKINAMDL